MSLSQLFHQGCFPPTSFNELGLDSQWYGAMGYQFMERAHMSCYSYGHAVNYMKGGLMCADRIITVRRRLVAEITAPSTRVTTASTSPAQTNSACPAHAALGATASRLKCPVEVQVSPGYANEITTPEGGWRMEGILSDRQSVVNGIVNGMRFDEWSPVRCPNHSPGSSTLAPLPCASLSSNIFWAGRVKSYERRRREACSICLHESRSSPLERRVPGELVSTAQPKSLAT